MQGKSVIFDISPQKKSASADLSVILIYSLFLFERQKEQASLLKHLSFWLTHLLPCSFLRIKRNKLLTHHMLIPSHYLPISLFLFLSQKEQVSLKLVSFFYTPTITIKAQPLWIVPLICETYFTFSNCTK